MSKKRRVSWLLVALVLFGLAALLMRSTRPAPARARHLDDDFPRAMRDAESRRMLARRVPFPATDAGNPRRARERDPFLAALPPIGGGNDTAVIVEAAAMQSMPIGRMFLRCMKKADGDERVFDKIGLTPDSIERVGVSDDISIAAGDFRGVHWDAALPGVEPEPYGSHAKIYDGTGASNGPRRAIADYDDRYVLVAKDRAELEAAIDRMEGGDDPSRAAVDDSEAYGEIYGTVGVDKIADILSRGEPELADRLRAAAEKIRLHVDATGDVLLVADVEGAVGPALGDLGKAMGGALSVGRMQAQAENDDKLGQLLEAARVRPHNDSFSVEVALPVDLLERELGPCAKGWQNDR